MQFIDKRDAHRSRIIIFGHELKRNSRPKKFQYAIDFKAGQPETFLKITAQA